MLALYLPLKEFIFLKICFTANEKLLKGACKINPGN